MSSSRRLLSAVCRSAVVDMASPVVSSLQLAADLHEIFRTSYRESAASAPRCRSFGWSSIPSPT